MCCQASLCCPSAPRWAAAGAGGMGAGAQQVQEGWELEPCGSGGVGGLVTGGVE